MPDAIVGTAPHAVIEVIVVVGAVEVVRRDRVDAIWVLAIILCT